MVNLPAVKSSSNGATHVESAWRRVYAANCRFGDAEKYSVILAESPNFTEARNTYIIYCNQEFPRADTVRLVSCILKGPDSTYWKTHIDGRPEFTELGGVFRALEYQFDTLHNRGKLSLSLCP